MNVSNPKGVLNVSILKPIPSCTIHFSQKILQSYRLGFLNVLISKFYRLGVLTVLILRSYRLGVLIVLILRSYRFGFLKVLILKSYRLGVCSRTALSSGCP